MTSASPFVALLGKELRAQFVQPIAWVLLAVYLLVMGYAFVTNLALTQSASLVRLMFQAAVLELLLIPLLTMRVLAEERRHGTLELLLATPAREADVVLAKYVACLLLLAVMLAPTLLYPAVLAWYGQPDWGPVYSGYLGLLLLGSLLTAGGLACSALTANQVVAATLGIGGGLLLWVVDGFAAVLPAPWDYVVEQVSLLARFTPFATGALYLPIPASSSPAPCSACSSPCALGRR